MRARRVEARPIGRRGFAVDSIELESSEKSVASVTLRKVLHSGVVDRIATHDLLRGMFQSKGIAGLMLFETWVYGSCEACFNPASGRG